MLLPVFILKSYLIKTFRNLKHQFQNMKYQFRATVQILELFISILTFYQVVFFVVVVVAIYGMKAIII